MKHWCVTIQTKAIEQYFHVVLFTMLHKVVLTFKSVDETLVCDHSNESYWAVLSCGTILVTSQSQNICTLLFFRLFESLCSSDSSNQFPSELRAQDDDDDECRSGMSSVASLAGSRTSSQWSLVKPGELDEEVIVSCTISVLCSHSIACSIF